LKCLKFRHNGLPLLLVEEVSCFPSKTVITHVAGHRPVIHRLALVWWHPRATSMAPRDSGETSRQIVEEARTRSIPYSARASSVTCTNQSAWDPSRGTGEHTARIRSSHSTPDAEAR